MIATTKKPVMYVAVIEKDIAKEIERIFPDKDFNDVINTILRARIREEMDA